jgi:acetyltransferase-like isoleucine patch superfamily enzyme
VSGRNGSIWIGENTTFTQVGISLHEPGQVVVGRDCMFSIDIHMDPSDMHPIYDRATGERLNPPQDIHIGDHVWLGARVLVMKGAKIGSGSIIGAGSIVAGEIPENALAVGTPARVVRENVVWTRDMDQKPQLVPGSGPATGPDRVPSEQAASPQREHKKRGWFR